MKINDRVEIDTFLFKGKGAIDYIDESEMFGIQVELDEPDNDGHELKRVNRYEVRLLNN